MSPFSFHTRPRPTPSEVYVSRTSCSEKKNQCVPIETITASLLFKETRVSFLTKQHKIRPLYTVALRRLYTLPRVELTYIKLVFDHLPQIQLLTSVVAVVHEQVRPVDYISEDDAS